MTSSNTVHFVTSSDNHFILLLVKLNSCRRQTPIINLHLALALLTITTRARVARACYKMVIVRSRTWSGQNLKDRRRARVASTCIVRAAPQDSD